MVKKKRQKKKINFVTLVIIVFLTLTNIILLSACLSLKDKEEQPQEIFFTKTDEEFDPKKKYYVALNYAKFKALYKSNKVTTIAILDNSTSTYNKYIEMINKLAYHKNTKMYLLRINKLAKKNELAFYNLDDRFKQLESNYIITISNSKILSITTFNNQELNKLIKGLGE